MTYIIRHWVKIRGEWRSIFEHVDSLEKARESMERDMQFLPADCTAQDWEIRREGSDTWRDLEDVLDGNPPLEKAEPEDYVGSCENMEPVVITRTPEDWEPRAEEGYRFDLMVLQGSTGEYWRLASFWHSGQAVAAWEALERACKLELEEVIE